MPTENGIPANVPGIVAPSTIQYFPAIRFIFALSLALVCLVTLDKTAAQAFPPSQTAVDSLAVEELTSQPGVNDSLTLTPHAPIAIDGAISDLAAAGIVTGTGTMDDPYVIRNWLIETQDQRGITIQNSDSHILIENVMIANRGYGQSEGIVTSNVKNLVIADVTVRNASYGIRLDLSSNVVVDSAHIINSFADGIILQGTDWFTFTHSLIEYTRYHGVAIHGPSSGVYVADNEIAYAGYYLGAGSSGSEGLIAYTEVTNLQFLDNIVHHGAEDGIEIVNLSNAVVANNVSHNNDDEGFDIYFSHDSLITGNRAFDNGGEGIVLTSADRNVVVGNLVDRNGIGYRFIDSAGIPMDNLLWGPAPRQNTINLDLTTAALKQNTVFFAGTEDLGGFPRIEMSQPTISLPGLSSVPIIRYEFGTQPNSGDQLWVYATSADGQTLWSNTEQHLMRGVVITASVPLQFATANYYQPDIIDIDTASWPETAVDISGRDFCAECNFLLFHQLSDLASPSAFEASPDVNATFGGSAQLLVVPKGASALSVMSSDIEITGSRPVISTEALGESIFDVTIMNKGPTPAPFSQLRVTVPRELSIKVPLAQNDSGRFACEQDTVGLRCAIEPLQVGQSVALPFLVSARTVFGSTYLSFELDNPVSDPRPATRDLLVQVRETNYLMYLPFVGDQLTPSPST